MRVLVVDDDPVSTSLLEAVLGREDCIVESTDMGAEALELAMQSTEMTAETRDFIEPIRRVLGVAVANGLDVVVIGSVN